MARDGERHGGFQFIAALGYWVYMTSYDNWADCIDRCEALCQQYGIGVWVDGQPGAYHPAANTSNTDAIRAIAPEGGGDGQR